MDSFAELWVWIVFPDFLSDDCIVFLAVVDSL